MKDWSDPAELGTLLTILVRRAGGMIEITPAEWAECHAMVESKLDFDVDPKRLRITLDTEHVPS